MRIICLALIGLLLAGEARAQSVAAPKVRENDTWTYQETAENRTIGWRQTQIESTVLRAGSTSIAISSKPVGSTMPPREQLIGSDWSRFRSINGHETVVNRPFSFPLSVGKTWELEYTEDHPNRAHSSEHFRTAYRVIGWEQVTVPAGTFHALKVEAEGQWFAAIAPAISAVAGTRVDAEGATTLMQSGKTAAKTVSGHTYKAFWYAPGVKRAVKSVEEFYDPNGARSERYESVLESFKVFG